MSAAGGYDEYAFIADLYDYVVPYRARADVRFYVDAAKEVGGPVLEVGCGTARVQLFTDLPLATIPFRPSSRVLQVDVFNPWLEGLVNRPVAWNPKRNRNFPCLTARAGFELEHVYAGFDKSPYGSKYPGELILVARSRSSSKAV